MYFASRMQAGRLLAEKLALKYQGKKCAVLALGDGGVMVAAPIAQRLHCVLTLLLTSEIKLPREPDALAGITAEGTVTFNPRYSAGEIDELVGEYRGLVEQEKLLQMHRMNELLGSGGTVRSDLLRGHTVIVVADGISSGFAVDLAYEFTKRIAIDKLVFATPLSNVRAVDRMHVLADDIICLDVVEDMRETDHYYDDNTVPDHDTIVEKVEHIILNWK